MTDDAHHHLDRNQDPESGTPDQSLGNPLFDIWLVSRVTTALIDEAIRPSGLNADEFAIYSVLVSGGAMTPTELARWMSAPMTTVSSYIRRFEQRDHLTRLRNPRDGRSYRIQLTDTGEATHRHAAELFAPVVEEVSGLLGSQVDDTHRRLRQLHELIGAVELPRS